MNLNAQIPSSSRFKRKRSIPKLLSPMNLNKTSMNIPPFALHNSIEIDNSSNDVSANGQNSNGNTNIPTLNRSSHREQLESHPFNSSTHPAFASPGQYSTSTFPKSNLNSSPFHQFNLHPERLTGHHRSFSFHYPHYSSPMKLSFPSPILPLSSGTTTTLDDSNVPANSTKKLKVKFLICRHSCFSTHILSTSLISTDSFFLLSLTRPMTCFFPSSLHF